MCVYLLTVLPNPGPVFDLQTFPLLCGLVQHTLVCIFESQFSTEDAQNDFCVLINLTGTYLSASFEVSETCHSTTNTCYESSTTATFKGIFYQLLVLEVTQRKFDLSNRSCSFCN